MVRLNSNVNNNSFESKVIFLMKLKIKNNSMKTLIDKNDSEYGIH